MLWCSASMCSRVCAMSWTGGGEESHAHTMTLCPLPCIHVYLCFLRAHAQQVYYCIYGVCYYSPPRPPSCSCVGVAMREPGLTHVECTPATMCVYVCVHANGLLLLRHMYICLIAYIMYVHMLVPPSLLQLACLCGSVLLQVTHGSLQVSWHLQRDVGASAKGTRAPNMCHRHTPTIQVHMCCCI